MLRAHDYLYDAKITPIAYDGETVDLEVRTKDVWTLNPGISFSRSGGENDAARRSRKRTCWGRGKRSSSNGRATSTARRSSSPIAIRISCDSFSRFGICIRDADDGETKAFTLRSAVLCARYAAGGRHFRSDSQRNDPRYALGHEVGEFQHRDELYERIRRRPRVCRAAGCSAGPPASPMTTTGLRLLPERIRAVRCPRIASSSTRGSVRLDPGRLPGAQQPGPDRADRGRAARVRARRPSRLCVGNSRLGSRRLA